MTQVFKALHSPFFHVQGASGNLQEKYQKNGAKICHTKGVPASWCYGVCIFTNLYFLCLHFCFEVLIPYQRSKKMYVVNFCQVLWTEEYNMDSTYAFLDILKNYKYMWKIIFLKSCNCLTCFSRVVAISIQLLVIFGAFVPYGDCS